MGKQYKKLVKRRRRTAYLARRKAALLSEKPAPTKKAKKPAASTAKSSSRKKAESKPKPVEAKEEVAEKVVKTHDVFGTYLHRLPLFISRKQIAIFLNVI